MEEKRGEEEKEEELRSVAKKKHNKIMSQFIICYNFDFTHKFNIGGNGLLHVYGRSLLKVLKLVFPDYHWLPWKFKKAPQRYETENWTLQPNETNRTSCHIQPSYYKQNETKRNETSS